MRSFPTPASARGASASCRRSSSPAEHYGTRASTVVLIDRDGDVLFIERAFGPRGEPLGVTEKRFALERSAMQPQMNADTR